MPEARKHSELQKFLRDEFEQLEKRVLIFTTGGVLEEGALVPVPAPAPAEPVKEYDSGFYFGAKSKVQAAGVKPELIAVAGLALKWSTQDFMIFDGKRTTAEQQALVKKGVSQTMKSMHLPQADGYAHAMDLVPVNASGTPVWEWPLIYPVVMAVDKAATHLGYAGNIVWGGAWDRRLSDFHGDEKAYESVVREYTVRHPGKDFIDGPHYEWRA